MTDLLALTFCETYLLFVSYGSLIQKGVNNPAPESPRSYQLCLLHVNNVVEELITSQTFSVSCVGRRVTHFNKSKDLLSRKDNDYFHWISCIDTQIS